MTADVLQNIMAEHGAMPRNRMVADSQFALTTENWFYGIFASALKTWNFQLGSTLWRSESNDCDDFTRLAAVFAQRCHAKTAKNSDKAIAIGEFWYSRPSPHAVVCAVVKSGEEYKLIFLEPQDQRPKLLSWDEISSCIAYRF